MKKIKYTSGTMKKLGDYYELTLFNNGKQIYIGTLDIIEASNLVNKSNKIKLI